MGTGILGAIPIAFRVSEGVWEGDKERYKKQFTARYPISDFYDEKEMKNSKIGKQESYYEIKPEVLLPQFKNFYYAFHQLIGEIELSTECTKFNDKYDTIVATNDLGLFMEHFKDHYRYDPYDCDYFEWSYIDCFHNLCFYRGSYKAILEEYSTLYHMEKLLVAAMGQEYPLAKLVQISLSL
jgi:hypothetical protein